MSSLVQLLEPIWYWNLEKKCYKAEIWLKHPEMCTIPKKAPSILLDITEISAILLKVAEIHRLKKKFFKRGHVWAYFKDNFDDKFLISNHGLKINLREVIAEKNPKLLA